MAENEADIDVSESEGATVAGRDIGIRPELHKEMMETALADLRKDLEAKHAESARADAAEREMLRMQADVLNGRIAEYERRVADPDAAYAEYQKRIVELEQLLQDATVEIGDNRIQAAKAEMEAGNYDLADEIFAEVEEHEARAVQRAAEAAYGRGVIAEENVRWADAAEHYAKAARLDPSYRALSKATRFALRSGNYPAALRFGEEALALARETGDQADLSDALNNQASNLYQTGQFDAAEPLFKEKNEVAGQIFGTDHRNYATGLNNLAEVYRLTGRHEEAEPLFREAAEILGKVLGRDHPDYAQSLNNRAALYEAMGRYEEAEALYIEAEEITGKALGQDHPNFATNLNNRAALYRKMGRYAEAEPLYLQAEEIWGKALGRDHPDYASSLNNRAVLYEKMGRYEEAEPLNREAEEIRGNALGRDHPVYAGSLNNRASLYYHMERYTEALPLMEQALTIWEAKLGPEHPNTVNSRNNLATIKAKLDTTD